VFAIRFWINLSFGIVKIIQNPCRIWKTYNTKSCEITISLQWIIICIIPIKRLKTNHPNTIHLFLINLNFLILENYSKTMQNLKNIEHKKLWNFSIFPTTDHLHHSDKRFKNPNIFHHSNITPRSLGKYKYLV
jgi:hypothetical protein